MTMMMIVQVHPLWWSYTDHHHHHHHANDQVRPLWRSYTRATDGIIFVLDAADWWTLKPSQTSLRIWRHTHYTHCHTSTLTHWKYLHTSTPADYKILAHWKHCHTGRLKYWVGGEGKVGQELKLSSQRHIYNFFRGKLLNWKNKAMNVLRIWDNRIYFFENSEVFTKFPKVHLKHK